MKFWMTKFSQGVHILHLMEASKSRILLAFIIYEALVLLVDGMKLQNYYPFVEFWRGPYLFALLLLIS